MTMVLLLLRKGRVKSVSSFFTCPSGKGWASFETRIPSRAKQRPCKVEFSVGPHFALCIVIDKAHDAAERGHSLDTQPLKAQHTVYFTKIIEQNRQINIVTFCGTFSGFPVLRGSIEFRVT